jgi:transposase
MKAYPLELRERVVAACDAGGQTHERIAERFDVSVGFIEKLLRQRRRSGSIAPKPRPGRPPSFDAAGERRLRGELDRRPDATLAELKRAAGADCCLMTVQRTLKRMEVTRKKSRSSAPSRSVPMCAAAAACGGERRGGSGRNASSSSTKRP